MHVAIGVLLVGSALGELGPDLVALFEKHQEEVAIDGESSLVHYRLFVPDTERHPDRRYPLVIWLHDWGERGNDNINQLRWLEQLVFRPPRVRSRYPFFLLAVQCPYETGRWYGRSNRDDRRDMLDLTRSLVERLIESQPIDRDRITVAGVSWGGTACWEFAARYPDLLAGAAPMGSWASRQLGRSEELTQVPIWAFHSEHDTSIQPDSVRRLVEELEAAGGRVHLTEIDSSDHDCWTDAFRQYDLLRWLLSQDKANPSWWNRPGRVPLTSQFVIALRQWNWWQLLAQACVIVLPAAVLARLALLARSRMRSSAAQRGN